MTIGEFRAAVESAAADGPGLKLLACLAVEPEWFAAIAREVQDLVARRAPSDVTDRSHPTYWTMPYGQATQHSLFNASGATSDTSVDHNHQVGAKSFNAPECPALHRFVRCFESRLLNFRVNGIQPESGLSPHQEFVVHGDRLRLRFHLPIAATEQAPLFLGEEKHYVRPGVVYYFNNGCVHGATNSGGDVRYHLVFDLFLDEWIWDQVLDPDSPRTPDPGLRKLTEAERAGAQRIEPHPIDEYVIGTQSGVVLRATRQRNAGAPDTWVRTPIVR